MSSRKSRPREGAAYVVAFALLAGCGGAPQEAAPKTAADKPADATPKPADKPADNPVDKPAEKAGPAAPKEKFALPNVTFDAERPKASLGGKVLSAEACLLDTSAPDMKHEWFDQAIRGLVAAKDGSLYVLDHEQKVRHYLVEPGDRCKLALDPAFGERGVLTLPTPADSITMLDDGVVAALAPDTLMRISGGKVESTSCRLKTLNAGGKTGFDAFSDEIEKVDVGATCKATPWKYTGWPTGEDKPSVQFVRELGKDVLVAASVQGTHYVGVHGADGKLKIKLGKDREKDHAQDGEIICWARDVDTCGAGLCVLDSNCRKLAAYDPKSGALVGTFEIADLLGLGYAWPSALVVGKGLSWVAASAKEPRPKDAPKNASEMNVGLIFRVKGLD